MDVIGAVRDILISLYLIMGIVFTLALLVFTFLLYKALRALIGAATGTVENFSKVSEAAVDHIVKPLEEGVSVGSVAGNTMGFVTGFLAGLRGRKTGDDDDGSGSGSGGRKWWPF